MEKLKRLARYYVRMILYVYLFLQIVIFPYYAPDGYVKLGANKFYFFRMVGIECLGLMIPAALFLLVCQGTKTVWKQLSATDWAMIFYTAAVVLSYVCTEWKRQAFWGTEGWSMGLMTQLMFAAIYFYVSRFGEKPKFWYVVFLAASFGVFLIGMLNRFSVYPLWREPDAPAYFISTIGNINWFCGYWSVVFPIGLVLYWSGAGDRFWKKAGIMLYVVMGFMVGIVQGSSSVFLVLGAVFVVLFLMSFEENDRFLRWLELVLLFAVSNLMISSVKLVFPSALNYKNGIEEWMTQYMTAGLMFGVTLICYAVARYLLIKMHKSVKGMRRRVYTTGIVVALLIGILIAIMLVYCNLIFEKTEKISPAVSLFLLDERWGNGRGATWIAAVKAFASMSLPQKIVGIGPDCFDSYVYGNPVIAEGLYAVFGTSRLTNAHNELLTALVNTGICGALSYASIFGTALLRQIQAGRQVRILLVSAICVFSYVVHNMVSFQQIASTPFVFIVIGFGERILRKEYKVPKSVLEMDDLLTNAEKGD